MLRQRIMVIDDKDFMRDGLSELTDLGIDVEVRHWGHDDLIGLQ